MNNDVHHPQHEATKRADEPDLGVLVGFDGSEQAILALYYAARAAQRSRSRLTVASAYAVPSPIYTTPAAIPPESEEATRKAHATSNLDIARELLQDYPGPVMYVTDRGDPAGVMVQLSAAAQLAVVGARGRGGFIGRLLGSVSSALPAHSHCPTVVVPRGYEIGNAQGADVFAPDTDDTPVVVGVDGSDHGRVAADVAAFAAVQRKTSLHLVMTIPIPTGWGVYYPELVPDPATTTRRQGELKELLVEEAARLHETHPDLPITVAVESGSPVHVLADLTRTSQLTVVGTRGHGRMMSVLLGSVSRGVLLHAEGPVMVVPHPQQDQREHSDNPR